MDFNNSTMNSRILLIYLCISSVSALDTPHGAWNTFLHWLDILKDKLVETWNTVKQKFVGMWHDVEKGVMAACHCVDYNCGCCFQLEYKEIGLDTIVCVNVTYLVLHDYGISATITVNKFTIFNETVSVRNPPPFCFGVPYVEDLEACIRLGDISVTTTHLHACIRLEARMKIVPLSLCEIGIPGCEIACLNIGPPGLSNVTPHKVYLETRTASHTSTATNMTVIAVGVTAGLILVAVVICFVKARARKRGGYVSLM